MYHPNRRYGNPEALRALTAGLSLHQVAQLLHRHPRTIRDWMQQKRKMPFWVAELLQLRHETALHDLRRMGIQPQAVLKLPAPAHVRERDTASPTARPSAPLALRATGQHGPEPRQKRASAPGWHE